MLISLDVMHKNMGEREANALLTKEPRLGNWLIRSSGFHGCLTFSLLTQTEPRCVIKHYRVAYRNAVWILFPMSKILEEIYIEKDIATLHLNRTAVLSAFSLYSIEKVIDAICDDTLKIEPDSLRQKICKLFPSRQSFITYVLKIDELKEIKPDSLKKKIVELLYNGKSPRDEMAWNVMSSELAFSLEGIRRLIFKKYDCYKDERLFHMAPIAPADNNQNKLSNYQAIIEEKSPLVGASVLSRKRLREEKDASLDSAPARKKIGLT